MNFIENKVMSCFSDSFDQNWRNEIIAFLQSKLQNSQVSFLSRISPKESICFYLLNDYKEIKTYDNTYYYYHEIMLNKEKLEELIIDEEFYLGNVLILLKPNLGDLLKYAICWESELIFTNIEIFKMDSDGLCFYWYNPKDYK